MSVVSLGGRYWLSAPTLSNGEYSPQTLDAVGRGLVVASGDVAAGATDSGNPVKIGGVYRVTPTTYTDGQRADIYCDNNGVLFTRIVVSGGNALTGVSGGITDGASNNVNAVRFLSHGVVFNGTTWDRERKANATTRIVSAAASTNGTSVKASAGDVLRISGRNVAAAARYLKLYNKASAPTVGTDTPVLTEYLPAGASFELSFPGGYYFSTGIALAMTVNGADADTTALTAGDIVGFNITYA